MNMDNSTCSTQESISKDVQDLNSKNPEESGEPQLSKRKRKRLLREQKWLEEKPERKRREKERRKARKLQQKQNGENSVPKTQNDQQITRPIIAMSASPCKVSIVIDCDYETFMNEHELRKLVKQLNRCYSINRHSQSPVQLWLTSISGKILELFNKLQPGHNRWDCHITDQHWSNIFKTKESNLPKEKLIYLSGDSNKTIPDCGQIKTANDYVFIIGGLIDHNRHKGLCLKRAMEEFECEHGQLPISEHCRLSQCAILSIPHVFQIMLLAANGTDGQDWSHIFQKVIPNRKLIKS